MNSIATKFTRIVSISMCLLLLSGCVDIDPKPVETILNEAIDKLESQSVNWENVLNDTVDELIKNGHTLVSNDVANILSRSISDMGIEARCYTDFMRDRVKEDLLRLRSQFTGEKLSLVPVFCNPTPSSVDYELVRTNQLSSVEIAGYNLDAAKIKVFLADGNDNRVDVTYALGNPAQYLITLNLGSNGVKLDFQSSKLIFVLPSTEERTVNINQPQPITHSFTPLPISNLCPKHIAGDKDFQGHGPDVIASAELFIADERFLWVKIMLRAQEWKADWTKAEKEWTYPLWTAPLGTEILEVSPSSPSNTWYVDVNHQLDYPTIDGSSLVSQFKIMGDTDGNDVGNCTIDDVYMEITFNEVQVKYRYK